jgi:predicted nucleic acid-binding Zn ribbon protein
MSDLEHIGPGVDEMLGRLGIPALPDLADVVERWSEVAGEPWASRSRPVGLEGTVLLVEVADGTTATLLRYQTGPLLERLADRVGGPLVSGVRIRVARPKNGL